MSQDQLTSVDDVLTLLDTRVVPRSAAPVALGESLGCVLAADVEADNDQPAFDRSAVDGFAVTAGALAGEFVLGGDILPGEPVPPPPPNGVALQVFTGSAVPRNCGLVMVEDTVVNGDRVMLKRAAASELIRRRGSSVRAGAQLLGMGDRIGPGELAVLASAGVARPLVIPPPRVLHLTTGREVVPVDTMPGPGRIRDTNGPLVRALLRTAGAAPLPPQHVDETVAALVAAVQAADEFDLLLVSGGSSVGAHDRTPQALEALGFELLVRRVNVRPGKSLLIARRGDQWAFGLPGNPVSHFAAFHVFVARAILRMRGREVHGSRRARLDAGVGLAAHARETFWPARLREEAGAALVKPRPWLDSGDLAALAGINALIRLPAGLAPVAGNKVEIVACPEPA